MTAPATDAAVYDTKHEVAFSQDILPVLIRMGVAVEDLRHTVGAGELHVTLYLPDHDPETRESVIEILRAFEESYGYQVSVAPSILFAEDVADTE